ncbi:MAG: hypothetical protein K8F62_08570 [Pseudorhodoplanes sp.]|nr:hypothetical protein [Pseudorhodoplanes sp.]
MKTRLRIRKDGQPVYEGIHDISDADTFGAACSSAWSTLREQKFAQASSIGALIDTFDQRILDEMLETEITLSKA